MAKKLGSQSTPEYLLCFFIGLEPEDLIKLGKGKMMVYYYWRKYRNQVKPNFLNIIKSLPQIKFEKKEYVHLFRKEPEETKGV